MSNPVNPLNQAIPIVNANGTPTWEFMRKWAQQFAANSTIPDLGNVSVLAGRGLTGGGPLSSDVTLSADVQAILDMVTSTRGSILYRGASGWVGLPPGTSGYFLKSNGTGADLSYAAVSAGDVSGPGSATDSDFVQFDGTTVKLIKDGGLSRTTDGTLSANSDSLIPSEKAVKTYVDNAAFSPAAAAFHPGFSAGRYYGGTFATSSGLVSAAANTLYGMPFFVPKTTTFTEALININSTGTATHWQAGVWALSGAVAGALLYDSGSVSMSGTGDKTKTGLTWALSPGWYVTAVAFDGTVTSIRAASSSVTLNQFVFGWTNSSSVVNGITGSWTYSSGTLPDPFPAMTYGTGTIPMLFLLL